MNLKDHFSASLNILFWKCQGIRPKRKELELYLKENVTDIIALISTSLVMILLETLSPPSQLSQPSRSESNKARIFVAGDSVVRDVKGWLLSRGKYVKVYSFSGADTEDMSDFIIPLINKKPDEIIIHCGTNDLCSIKIPEEIVDNILKLWLVIVSYEIRCTVSNIVKREGGWLPGQSCRGKPTAF